MVKKKNETLRSLLESIDVYQKPLKEAGIFDSDMGGGMQPRPGMTPQRPEMGQDGQQQEPQSEDLSEKDPLINKIRSASLEGLKRYAENVDSEEYAFFKKVFLLCDKAVSQKENVSSAN